ncbi:MAG TPA: LysM peptidoglycan-binding domain-containing protein [Caldilineaceae bacterium]|nr:LysM peptidoglycan-binding domain-containing protein [Caldilineaceae bacterium]
MVRRPLWLAIGVGIAFLWLGAAHGVLLAFAGEARMAQAAPKANRPAPPAAWANQTAVTPTVPAAAQESAAPADPPMDISDIGDSPAVTATTAPTYYIVAPGDTLYPIAVAHGTTVEALMAANGMSNPDLLHAGQVLTIPGPDGELPDPALMPVVIAGETLTQPLIVPRGTITERLTSLAQAAGPGSPYYGTTWLTYYGRPTVEIMGILGEHSLEDLTPLLRAQAEAYDRANGPALTVTPAFHLVYGMATKAPGEDNSHLAFMADEEVMAYIEAAEAEGWAVILDVQIGALSPTAAITPALRFLAYPNVHLAIDPEFAMVHPGQVVPGDPIGYVTAGQINLVQAVVNTYLAAKQLPAPRILLVHQFQSSMIVEPEKIDTTTYAARVALTLSVDGWGGPWGKISKYNSFITPGSPFAAFKLFYRWDEPLLTPDEALGNRPFRGSDFFIEVTPNLIIYQ